MAPLCLALVYYNVVHGGPVNQPCRHVRVDSNVSAKETQIAAGTENDWTEQPSGWHSLNFAACVFIACK